MNQGVELFKRFSGCSGSVGSCGSFNRKTLCEIVIYRCTYVCRFSRFGGYCKRDTCKYLLRGQVGGSGACVTRGPQSFCLEFRQRRPSRQTTSRNEKGASQVEQYSCVGLYERRTIYTHLAKLGQRIY